jgi:uncharacterized membrane protein YgdD (TMEM256/DUF423 family)
VIRALAALSAAVAIMAGAFGAHAATGQAIEWLKTGAFYQLVHAVALLGLGQIHPVAQRLLLCGSVVFATTLYLMALGFPHWLGAITPIGGALMIIGWLMLAYRFWRHRSEQ